MGWNPEVSSKANHEPRTGGSQREKVNNFAPNGPRAVLKTVLYISMKRNMHKPNKHAQQLARLGRGVPRRISEQDRERRRAWMLQLNARRRAKRKE